jgi:acyl carrier protein
VEKVGITDDFFRIGGNSIMAIRIISHINKMLSIQLSVKELFLNTTIKSICVLIQTKTTIKNESSQLLNDQNENLSNEENLCPVLPLQIARYKNYKSGVYSPKNGIIQKELNNVNKEALYRALDTLVSRHESLRILFIDREGEVLQRIFLESKFTSTIDFEDICGQKNKKGKIESIINEANEYLFDFQKERPFKCKLLKYQKNKYLFIFIIDHIIFDAHSLKIIEEELFILYYAYSKGNPNPLEPVKQHLRDYMNLYLQHYKGDKLLYHQSYYNNLFKDFPPKLTIKPINPSAKKTLAKKAYLGQNSTIATKKMEGGVYIFIINKEILDQIQIVTSELKISLFNFMLASYSVFLNKISNQKEFFIDSPMSVRINHDSLKIIGWLMGSLVTRVTVHTDSTFRDLLFSCRNHIVEAVDHIFYQSFVNDLNLEWEQFATQLNLLNDLNTPEGMCIRISYSGSRKWYLN